MGVDAGNTMGEKLLRNYAGRIQLCARSASNQVRPSITPFVTVRSASSNFAVLPGQKPLVHIHLLSFPSNFYAT